MKAVISEKAKFQDTDFINKVHRQIQVYLVILKTDVGSKNLGDEGIFITLSDMAIWKFHNHELKNFSFLWDCSMMKKCFYTAKGKISFGT